MTGFLAHTVRPLILLPLILATCLNLRGVLTFDITAVRRLLTEDVLDPGNGKRAAEVAEKGSSSSAQAIRSKYDHDILHEALEGKSGVDAGGVRSSRGRGGSRQLPCAMTRGSWCKEYFRQTPVPWKPGPRGSKDCPSTEWGPCNGVGNCHYDIGVCQCPAGWKGGACNEPDKRPCTNAHKEAEEPLDKVKSFIGPDGMDLDLSASGWTASRCAGYCDDDRASCWCPANATFGRKPPPPGSPPWLRYSARGRPILQTCKPGMVFDREGLLRANDWGDKLISIGDLLGAKGWCNAETVEDLPMAANIACNGAAGCQDESLHGPLCGTVTEETCLNQCTGHGECDSGYCRCFKGWYGEDCARKKAGEGLDPGLEASRPWLQPVVMPVPAAALEPPPATVKGSAGTGAAESPVRMRPLIYVYDMPPEFTSRMLQYKHVDEHCGYRRFIPGNKTQLYTDTYSIEVYLHEMLAVSPHRTFDPEEADFFYVPVYYTCWMWPINGWADKPFYGAPSAWHRFSNAAHMWLKAKRWIQANFPFWDWRGGRDHIFLTNHDEGACYMPTEIYRNAIMLTHWGLLGVNHTSNTAYTADDYSAGLVWPGVLRGKDVKTLYEGHACYDPVKDLVIPSFKAPAHFSASPLLGAWPWKRDILLYLRGDVGKHRLKNYSRGLRQKLYKLAQEHRWAAKHRIFVGDQEEIRGAYGEHLARSIFCAVVPGDGYSPRLEDAVLHGCLPLILMDDTHVVFESVVEVDAFSLRLREAALDENLPQVLLAISPDQIERMQRRLALVWHRFAYGHGPVMHAAMRSVIRENKDLHKGIQSDLPSGNKEVPKEHPYQPVYTFPVHNDALVTILQWLHSRIPHTRGSVVELAVDEAISAEAESGDDNQR